MITILLGILSSSIAEIVTALNKKLAGTVLAGDAAFLIALGAALVLSTVKVFWVDGVPLPSPHDLSSWQALAPAFTEVWTVSQIYFLVITKRLGMDVQSPAASAGI